MRKLIRKDNQDARYDRLEHFKRFPNLNKARKDLAKIGWIIIHKKPKFVEISLNIGYKREIIEFIEKEIPRLIQ